MGLVKANPGGGRRLMLGFDAECATCSDLAKRIEEAVGDKLEVRSLHDRQMQHWRKQALGENAPWVPTLVEVGEGKAKAWTGMQMGARLSRVLGLVTTWRVMKTLGDAKANVRPVDPAGARVGSTLARSQFLKRVGGAALALGIFSGTALPAFATGGNKAVEAGKQAERAIALMERHMEIRSNGTLFLNEKGLNDDIRAGLGEGIDRSVFAALKQNLADTNAKLLRDKAPGQSSKAKAEDLFPTVSPQVTERSGNFSRAGCAGRNAVQYFWWGRRSWIDNCNKLVRRLYANTGVLAIIACFPVGGAPAAMASAIIGLGGYAIDSTNRGHGVYINYIARLIAVRVRPQ